MSVMLYPCMLCVALLMCLFVLCVACLTVFVNCLVKQFAMCVGVVAILLLNVMDVFSVCGGALLDRPCMGNRNRNHQYDVCENSVGSVYVGGYGGLSESGLCVFCKLCPVCFLVVGKGPSVLL